MLSHRVNSITSGRNPPFVIMYTDINHLVETSKQNTKEHLSGFGCRVHSQSLDVEYIVRGYYDEIVRVWM